MLKEAGLSPFEQSNLLYRLLLLKTIFLLSLVYDLFFLDTAQCGKPTALGMSFFTPYDINHRPHKNGMVPLLSSTSESQKKKRKKNTLSLVRSLMYKI